MAADGAKAALSRAVPPGAFAVLDGAQWNDLQAELSRLRLRGSSLFREAPRDVELAGPFLVPLGPERATRDAVIDFVADKPAAAFWAGPMDEATLWRHLRTLNQVRLARLQPTSPEGPRPAPSELVLFRHWDPRALSVVMPALNGSQYARVLGPADQIVFYDPPEDAGRGLRRVVRLPDLEAPAPGVLSLDLDQVHAMDETMAHRSRERVAAFLRTAAPDQAGPLGPEPLRAAVATYQTQAAHMGVHGERSVGLWAHMQLTSTQDLSREQLVWRYLADPAFGPTPDHRMQALFNLRTRAAPAR